MLLEHFQIKPIKLKENRQYLVKYNNLEMFDGNGLEVEKYLINIGSDMASKVTIDILSDR